MLACHRSRGTIGISSISDAVRVPHAPPTTAPVNVHTIVDNDHTSRNRVAKVVLQHGAIVVGSGGTDKAVFVREKGFAPAR